MLSQGPVFKSPPLVGFGIRLGSTTFTNLFTQQRVSERIEGVSRLSTFAETQPHASYAAFTYGYLPKWKYYFRTTINISNLLFPLEFAIRGHFLPKLVLHPASDNEHQLFCLPVHFGGLGISNPVLTSDEQYDFSKELLQGYISLIFHQNPEDIAHHQNLLLENNPI